MTGCLASLNEMRNRKCLGSRNDPLSHLQYGASMAHPQHDWYLKDWLRTLGKKQADIVRDLDWNKARVSLTASGKQPYNRDDVNEVADYLNLRPYELLMHPEDAMRLRRLRDELVRLAADSSDREDSADREPGPKKVSAG